MPYELQLLGNAVRDYPKCWDTDLNKLIHNLLAQKEIPALNYAKELALIKFTLTVKLFLLHRPLRYQVFRN